MQVLLIEDDVLLAIGTSKLLERIGGHQVFITADPAEVLDRCEAGIVDLVIMDLNLQGARWQGQKVDGFMLSRYLKAQCQGIPIIIVTAYCLPPSNRRF